MINKSTYLVVSALFTVALTGCSGSSAALVSPGTTTAQSITISAQPVSQTVPLGTTATFSVHATGKGSLSYQWTRNGSDISGATSSSYTTAALTSSDNSSTYNVVIKDVSGSLASESATLSAGPRSPQAGDLRLLLFQQATATGLGASSQASNLTTNSAVLYPGAVGSPLELGSSTVCQPGVEYSCDWAFFVESLPATQNGLTMLYQGRDYQHFTSDLNCIEASNVVVHSIDLEPANNAYAMAWVSTFSAGGFDLRTETVAPSAVSSAAAQDGTESRVITAVSFDADGQAVLLSYGWTGDTHSIFETKTVLTTLDGIADAAKKLSAAGYIISAFGGSDANGYLLVGTRVQGDTIPRVLAITTSTGTVTTTSATQSAYSTPVVRFATADGTQTLISQY
jgi:hypothetical protein